MEVAKRLTAIKVGGRSQKSMVLINTRRTQKRLVIDMAAEKLNQAFIKAYGKRKVKSDSSDQNAASAQQESWLVRFDTATVQSTVPQMHNQRPPQQATASPTPTDQPLFPARLHLSSQPSNQSIDQQMPVISQGGGDFDNPGNLLVPTDDWSSLWGSTTMIVPQANLRLFRENPIAANQSGITSPLESSLGKGQGEQSYAAKVAEATSNSGSQDESAQSRSGDSGQQNEGPSLNPEIKSVTSVPDTTPAVRLHSPAASTLDASKNDSEIKSPTDDQSDVNVGPDNSPRSADQFTADWRSSVKRQIAAKNREGDIIRLDRPERVTTPDSPVSQQTENEQSRIRQPIALQRLESPAEEASDNSQQSFSNDGKTREKIRAAEEGLRKARKRIFNPLWEVDRLEWPRICLELLSTIEERSPVVAQNLSQACEEGLQVLAVTSPLSGAGTTTVACCLAMLAGRHGLNIALIDGNLENPTLCYQTNLEIEQDWTDAVAKRLPLEEIAVHSIDDQITMIPLLARLSSPQVTETSLATALQELSQSFDLVVVDMGPMSTAKKLVNSLGMMGILNAVVTVIDRRTSSSNNLESCLQQIRSSGISSIGLVENFSA
jgi:Mrp family chromosome partitioning ATPase